MLFPLPPALSHVLPPTACAHFLVLHHQLCRAASASSLLYLLGPHQASSSVTGAAGDTEGWKVGFTRE